MTRLWLPLALILLASTITALAPSGTAAFNLGANAERAYWGDTPSEASPGEHGRLLTVELRNEDSIEFYDVRAELVDHANLTPSYTGAEITHLGKVYASGDLWKAQFRVDIAENQTAGQALEVEIKVEMRANEDGGTFSKGDRRTETLDVSLALPGRAEVGVDASPDRLRTDTRTPVDLAIVNQGDGQAGTLEITFAPGSGSDLEVLAPQRTVRLDALAPGARDSVPVTLLAPSTTGVHTLEVTIDHANAVGEPTSLTRTLPFVVADRGHGGLEIRLMDAHVTAGRAGHLTFQVTNTGDAAIHGAELSIDPTTGTTGDPELVPVNGSGYVEIGTLGAGGSQRVTVGLLAAKEASDVQSVEVGYRFADSAGFEVTGERVFGVLVEGAIEVKLSGLDARLDPRQGEVTVEGRVTNTGNTEATNVYLELLEAPGITGTEALYQGDLDPDSPIPFTLASPANATLAPGNVTVLMTWTNDQGQARELVTSVPLREVPTADPGPSDEGTSRSTPTVGLGVAIAILAAAAIAARREP